jgi:lipopolysaccharide export system ATP-binding protein
MISNYEKLTTHAISKTYYGRAVVQDLSIQVSRGEIVGLLGPNGAGKTTTFYIVVGLLQPDKGTVCLDGVTLTHLPMHRRARLGIGYLPQEPSIFRKMTVEENIIAILETLPHTPTRRRVELARLLAASPHFILLDEPFTGIDPIMVGEIQALIFHLKKKGIGVFITDHRVRETLEITDRAYILHAGRVLYSGTPHELVESREVKQIYLGEKFSLFP